MRRLALTLVLLGALVVPSAAIGAGVEKGLGESCPTGQIGTWHFINIQTGGEEEPASLIAIFELFDRDIIVSASASKVIENVQHFVVRAPGLLRAAFTETTQGSLAGELMLTHVKCETE